MPRMKTVLQFEDEEKELLRQVGAAKLVQNAVKPLQDELKELGKKLSQLANAHNPDTDDVAAARQSLDELVSRVDQLPESEAQDIIKERAERLSQVLQEALSL